MSSDEEAPLLRKSGDYERLAAEDVLSMQQNNATETSALLANEAQGQRASTAQAIIPSVGVLASIIPFIRKYSAFAWSKIKQNIYFSIPAALLTLLIITIVVTLVLKTEVVFDKATHLVLSSIEIDGTTPTGLTLEANGTITFDYSTINWFYQAIYYPATFILGTVIIDAINPIEIFVNFPNSVDPKYYNPVNVHIPQVWFDLSSKSVNAYQFSADVDINSFDAVRTYHNFLLSKELNKTSVEIKVLFKSKFKIHKYIPLGQYSASIERIVTIGKEPGDMFEYTIDSFSIHPTNDTIDCELEVTINSLPVPINLALPQIEWDIYLVGCGYNFLYLGTFFTDAISISKLEPVYVDAKAIIPQLSKKLTKFCEDGISPVNRFVKKALDDKSNVFVKARATSNINQRLPKWLYIFLSNNFQPVPIDLKDLLEEHDSILDYTLGEGRVVIANDEHSLPWVDANVNITLNDLPFDNANQTLFEVNQVIGDLCFLHDDISFLKIYLHSWQQVATENNNFSFEIRGTKFDIVDDEVTANLIGQYLNGNEIEIAGKSLLDVDAKTPVFDTIFQSIEHDFTLLIQGTKGLFESLKLELGQLSYIKSSTETQLRTFVSVKFWNFFKFGAGIQFLNFNLSYNGTAVGNIDISDTIIPSFGESIISSNLRFNIDQEESKLALEELISQYISNKSPSLIVSGHPGSSKVVALAKVLSRLSIPIEIPSFKDPDEAHDTGFLVGCTFYILASEVEIEVYNPIVNQDVQIEIKHTKVTHNGVEIAYVKNAPILILPPGLSTTQRIPVTYPKKVPEDLLRKAINGNLNVSSIAEFDLLVDKFPLNLVYEGDGLTAAIRL